MNNESRCEIENQFIQYGWKSKLRNQMSVRERQYYDLEREKWAQEHEEKTNGAFEVTDPKLMPKETVNVVGIGFRKSDNEFREAFNAALAKVLANPSKMLERAGKYGYDKAQLPPPDMTTEWACATK